MTTWSGADPRFRGVLTVAGRLGALCDASVFLGGAVIPLLITDPGAASARPTDDVDIAVEITTKSEYYRLGERLRGLGFAEESNDHRMKADAPARAPR